MKLIEKLRHGNEEKDAEFMALQAQINPTSFLTHEIINPLIEVEKYDTACEVNARLSALLCATASTIPSGINTLAEEINYMNNYVHPEYPFQQQIYLPYRYR